ncbi:IS630 family transposase [Amycolatopsis sp. H20-H5]|uniref:IS630 family transposase n=1 Tax=Amycolatopsis sp. H20-H5 TaxID=3046309 RepID=UPI002DBDF1E3|nr:IS630 family transposase [Amycolatopsis sp. H20-H5]MEC3974367.1 IS630 family transposase [Amycolatopsis sp. H20-H5]
MPQVQACPVIVTDATRWVLTRRARGQKTQHRDKVRAWIVLLAAQRWSNAAIAIEVGIGVDTMRTWRGRFAAQGLAGLLDRARSGRPPRFSPVQVAQVKALACQLPVRAGVALSRWSCPELAREVVGQGIAEAISASTVWRWLVREAIKPWQYRSWLFPRDPDFAEKAGRVLDLYERRWEGQRLGPREYVISSDEKTSIQARCRCHPSLAPGQARMMRVNHEYERGGALAYLAAYDVHQARVFGSCAPSTGIVPFMALAEQVMTLEPYASAKRVFWVVDNGSSHRGQTAINRLAARFPNTVMVHTPVHASWLNQVEIFFSVVQRKVFSPNDFTDLAEVEQRLVDFEKRYNATAKPFQWKFTGDDLRDLLIRIAQHEQQETGIQLRTAA